MKYFILPAMTFAMQKDLRCVVLVLARCIVQKNTKQGGIEFVQKLSVLRVRFQTASQGSPSFSIFRGQHGKWMRLLSIASLHDG